MSGASPTGAVVADLAYFYRHEARRPPRFSIVGGSSGTAIADVARGVVDAGLTTRPLQPGDPPGLRFTPLGLSAICLVTNVANPVPNFTRAQVQDLVAGRIATWSQIPGSPLALALDPASPETTAGAYTVFVSTFVDLNTPLAYRPRTLLTTAQLRDYVQASPGAWSFVDLAFVRGVHAVPFEGVPCNRATVVSGAYPARTALGLVTRGRPRGALARFLRWIARDATARRVIRTRYIPV
jgi:phosphate transport system substrate-binding protein